MACFASMSSTAGWTGNTVDPLELRQDSALGAAGLVNAIRAGKVAVVNLPGSALVETPAFAPFLPALARRLLDEELNMPAVTTWWCGQASALHAVQESIDSFVLRPTFDPISRPVDPTLLGTQEREDDRRRGSRPAPKSMSHLSGSRTAWRPPSARTAWSRVRSHCASSPCGTAMTGSSCRVESRA